LGRYGYITFQTDKLNKEIFRYRSALAKARLVRLKAMDKTSENEEDAGIDSNSAIEDVSPVNDTGIPVLLTAESQTSSKTAPDNNEVGFCHKCGKRIIVDSNFCPYCGSQLLKTR